MGSPSVPPKRLRILMLHGFTQSGPLFHSKTRALEKNLKKAFPAPAYELSLHYPTGPQHIRAPDMPGGPRGEEVKPADLAGAEDDESWGWFRRTGEMGSFVYEGLEGGLERIADTMRSEGPFDGVVGFSQGGFMSGIVASLLEEGRPKAFEQRQAQGGMPFPTSFLAREGERSGGELFHPTLKFAVSYSGFIATTNPLYDAFYTPKIKTPMLHILGSMDTVVEEARSLRLARACEVEGGADVAQRRVVYHPSGHFVPSSKPTALALIAFVRETMGWGAPPAAESEGQDDDVDLPF